MASQRSTNTMEEFLRRIMGQIAEAKTLPDADLEYLVNLETNVLGRIRAPYDQMQAMMQNGGGPGMPPAPPGQVPPAMMGGAPMPPPGMGAPPMAPPQTVAPPPGLSMSPPMPNPDELARLIRAA